MSDISVLIYSCDAYSDIWGIFFKLFFRYWKCPYQVYLATETEQCLIPDVKTINADGKWTDRIRESVKEIPSKYIIGMCEDFFFRREVRQNTIDECITCMEQDPNIACFNFEKEYGPTDPGLFAEFGRKPNGSDWRRTCQAALWRKDVLVELLDGSMDAWEWETLLAPDKFNYYVYTGDENNLVFEYGYHNAQWFGIKKGKWVESDVRPLFEKEDIDVDLSIRGTV